MRQTELGGLLDWLDEHTGGQTPAPPTYQGTPLAPGFSLADVKPGGRYFTYAAIGGALVVAALAVYIARR